jgi:hypothetical protein
MSCVERSEHLPERSENGFEVIENSPSEARIFA